MPKSSADINRLQIYDFEENFKEMSLEADSKNASLLEFIKTLLVSMCDDRKLVTADIYKRASELLNSHFKELFEAYLKDGSFLDRIDEYVQDSFNDVSSKMQGSGSKGNGGSTATQESDSTAKISEIIQNVFENEAKESDNSVAEVAENYTEKYQSLLNKIKEANSSEERSDGIGDTASSTSEKEDGKETNAEKEEQKVKDKENKKKEKEQAEEAKKISKFIDPMVKSFNFMSKIDEHLSKSAKKFDFGNIHKSMMNIAHSVMRGSLKGIRSASGFIGKILMTGALGPLSFLVKPLSMVSGVIVSASAWLFRTVTKTVGIVVSPFTKLLKKLHTKHTSLFGGILASAFIASLFTPHGMYVLGFITGFIYKSIKRLFVKEAEHNKSEEENEREIRELSDEEKKRVEKEYGNFLINGTVFRLLSLFGDGVPQQLDHFAEVAGTIIFGHDKILASKRQNVENEIKRLESGETPTLPTWITYTAEKIEGGWSLVIDRYNDLKKNLGPVMKQVMEDGLLTEIRIGARFLSKLYNELAAAFPLIFGAGVAHYAASWTASGLRSLIGGLTKAGVSGAAKFGGFGFGIGANPYVIAGAVLAAAGAGVVNALTTLAKTVWNDEKNTRNRLMNERKAEAILRGESTDFEGFFETERKAVRPLSMEGIFQMWRDSRAEILGQQEAEKMQKLGGLKHLDEPKLGNGEEEIEGPGSIGEVSTFSIESLVNSDDSFSQYSKYQGFSDSAESRIMSMIGRKLKEEWDSLQQNQTGEALTTTLLPELKGNEDEILQLLKDRKSIAKIKNVPENIDLQTFKKYRTIFLLGMKKFYEEGHIDFARFMELYNVSMDPENKIYKMYAVKPPKGFWPFFKHILKIEGETFKGLAKIYGENPLRSYSAAGDSGLYKKVPFYFLFQKMILDEQRSNANPNYDPNRAWKGHLEDVWPKVPVRLYENAKEYPLLTFGSDEEWTHDALESLMVRGEVNESMSEPRKYLHDSGIFPKSIERLYDKRADSIKRLMVYLNENFVDFRDESIKSGNPLNSRDEYLINRTIQKLVARFASDISKNKLSEEQIEKYLGIFIPKAEQYLKNFIEYGLTEGKREIDYEKAIDEFLKSENDIGSGTPEVEVKPPTPPSAITPSMESSVPSSVEPGLESPLSEKIENDRREVQETLDEAAATKKKQDDEKEALVRRNLELDKEIAENQSRIAQLATSIAEIEGVRQPGARLRGSIFHNPGLLETEREKAYLANTNPTYGIGRLLV